jgi:hypothetical protein
MAQSNNATTMGRLSSVRDPILGGLIMFSQSESYAVENRTWFARNDHWFFREEAWFSGAKSAFQKANATRIN